MPARRTQPVRLKRVFFFVFGLLTLFAISVKEPPSVAAAAEDRYRLVFPTGSEGKFYRQDKKTGRVELLAADHSMLVNFVAQLNEAGARGYKLVAVTYTVMPVAVMELGGARYEYEWFETASSYNHALAGSEDKYAELSKRGFRFAEHLLLSSSCSDNDPNDSSAGQTCESRHLFLLVREKGVEKPTGYFLATLTGKWGGAPGAELTALIRQKLDEGYSPVATTAETEILFERGDEKEEISAGRSEALVVPGRRFWMDGDRLSDRVNERAKRGYRLALVYDRIALMYRRADDATPAHYEWLKSTDMKNWKLALRGRKDFEKQVAKLQARGAVYRMVYTKYEENILVFELKGAGDGGRREYQTLQFEFQVGLDAAGKELIIDLAPQSRETISTLNGLAGEGFEVRDMFVSPHASVLLERTR
ncbi:MAG TPA: hypothetical protein VM864_10140 [Pyrinomonadaceae bacterium]|jgi:hypothetical protein|nr:hypothetical protein [Pyrinomonadaceae bacterium]